MQKADLPYKSISAQSLPATLRELAQVPSVLYTAGKEELLHSKPIVGIVGARKYTPYGKQVTAHIADSLAEAGLPIVSGLALGVDSIAHRACVERGSPTIAVLPSGLNTIYPSSHSSLARQIIDKGGLLVSEYEAGERPLKHRFIERNRIIAALADVLIVTEAAERSGSLHTARFALELGKTVMAVPGPITSPYSSGTNRLIQSGAYAVLSPEDVLGVLGLSGPAKASYLPENEVEARILSLLSNKPSPVNDLISNSGLETPVLQTHLTILELKGAVEVSAGVWSRK